MEKAYEPQKHEAEIYKLWEDSGAFKPSGSSAEPFTIIMPPPNANGDLHAGHGMYVVDDILVRYNRMQGRPTLWQPGTDHAGIETQVVYERELAKSGKSRFDLGPEEFYHQVEAFTRVNQTKMLNQMRSLGFSADWSRLKFTLDSDITQVVYETFKKLHDDGLVYRGNRIVNWCPRCRAAFADIEIKHREQVDPLYYLKYGPFVLATVRPETKFGDTAVAVHPEDSRYQQLIGQEIEAEGLLGKFSLKVIADEHVDPAFGTGVIKVTPAHDHNDWEIGQRHGLEVKQAIGTDGRLTDICGKYAGMEVADARVQVAQDLEEAGLIDHIEMDYRHNIAIHDRCGTPIEPLVTEQWWLKVDELKQPAIKAIQDGQVTFYPARFKDEALDWLENLRDWNISRQIWWGMKIPVFYRANQDETKQPYLITCNEQEAAEYYGAGNYEGETDTFDTWFSSGQWPFATLMTTGDMERFYPTQVMGTMRDILHLWVTRMIMLGIYRTGQVPFRRVYLWGAVNDSKGKKMSKSRGNVINPLEMTSKYGTDALRLALTIGVTPGTGGSLSEEKILGYRNFNNKLWNVARFCLSQAQNTSVAPPQPATPADHWIMQRLQQAVTDMTASLDDYQFSVAGQKVYSLLWNDFADWYLEASKQSPNTTVLQYGLETILRLAHPFAPFVTEAIWQQLPWRGSDLITESWPADSPDSNNSQADQFEEAVKLIAAIRSVKAMLGTVELLRLYSPTLPDKELVEFMARVKVTQHMPEQKERLAVPGTDGYLHVSPAQLSSLKDKLAKLRNDKASYIQQLERKLSNSEFSQAAPAEIVAAEEARLTAAKGELEAINSQLDELA